MRGRLALTQPYLRREVRVDEPVACILLVTLVRDDPDLLAPFDRIVVATGAPYPLGTGELAMGLLDLGAGHWPLVSQVMTQPEVRDWFYYRARTPTGGRFVSLAKPNQKIIVIGDAAKAGKSKEAIGSAFEAALLGA